MAECIGCHKEFKEEDLTFINEDEGACEACWEDWADGVLEINCGIRDKLKGVL